MSNTTACMMTQHNALFRRDTHDHLTPSITLGVLVIVVSITGTAANTLSFSYFARKSSVHLARNLTLFLNAVDFMVCTWSLFGVFVFVIETPSPGQVSSSPGGAGDADDSFDKAFRGLRNTDMFVTATGYATCLLSVTRTISLLRPFCTISGQMIVAANCVFLLYIILTKIVIGYSVSVDSPLLTLTHYLSAIEISVTIATVTLCCLLCSYKLIASKPAALRSNISPRNRHGTITIIIISVLFCVVHLCYLLSNVVRFHIMGGQGDMGRELLLLKELSSFVGIPVNSAINPIIYFVRQRDMRRYVMTTKLVKCCAHCCALECCGKDLPDLSDSHMARINNKPPVNFP